MLFTYKLIKLLTFTGISIGEVSQVHRYRRRRYSTERTGRCDGK